MVKNPNEKIEQIWLQCWATTHDESILIGANELAELMARSLITLKADKRGYWFNDNYHAFRSFLIGRASI